jgi:hypothetical protein
MHLDAFVGIFLTRLSFFLRKSKKESSIMRSIMFVFLFLLAGCSWGGKHINPLNPDVRSSLFIKSVSVAWSEGAVNKNNSKSINEKQKLDDLTAGIKKAVEFNFVNSPSGSEAASIIITLNEGGTSHASGSAAVVRERDRAILVTYDISAISKRSGFMQMVQGKDSKISEVSTIFASLLYREFYT